jgi:hypothetical protein
VSTSNWSTMTPEEIASKPRHVQAQIMSYRNRTPWTKADGKKSNAPVQLGRGRARGRHLPELTERGMAGLCLALVPRD